MSGPPCAIHGSNMDWLATTNEWEFHCKPCDKRYNRRGEAMPAEEEALPREEPIYVNAAPDPHEPAPSVVTKADLQFGVFFQYMMEVVHQNAIDKGFWEKDAGDGQAIALMHSELGEMTEGLRHGNPPDDHIPEFNCAEAESADTIIRLMDLAQKRGWRLAEAIIAKVKYNATRPYKHGGKLF